MPKKLKAFRVQPTGLKPRPNTKGPKGSSSKLKRQKSNSNLAEESCWSEGQRGFSNCIKKRWKDGKAGSEKRDSVFTRIKYD